MKNRILEGRNSTLKLRFEGINLPRTGRKTCVDPFFYAMGYKYNHKIDPSSSRMCVLGGDMMVGSCREGCEKGCYR
jgi:hypothetical protein